MLPSALWRAGNIFDACSCTKQVPTIASLYNAHIQVSVSLPGEAPEVQIVVCEYNALLPVLATQSSGKLFIEDLSSCLQ